jgi:hypothetical protein
MYVSGMQGYVYFPAFHGDKSIGGSDGLKGRFDGTVGFGMSFVWCRVYAQSD